MPGKHWLLIRTGLEDLAGKSIGRPFEVDLFEKVDRERREETLKLAFEVREGVH
jgi:hypothetical protein